jgi:hypothetical protein
LKERREDADLIMASKLLNGKLPVKSDNWPKLANERGRENPHNLYSHLPGQSAAKTFSLCGYVSSGIDYHLDSENQKM